MTSLSHDLRSPEKLPMLSSTPSTHIDSTKSSSDKNSSSINRGDTEPYDEDSFHFSSTDSYAYDPEQKFSLGYKFKEPRQDDNGDFTTVIGKVVEVRVHNKRFVEYDDGKGGTLHVTDIKEYEPSPMFQHYLRVGDKIGYYDKTQHDDELVGIVEKIGESTTCNSDLPNVVTSLPFAPLTDFNNQFRIVSSNHDDAPPQGKWTKLSKVNLVHGEAHSDSTKEEMEKSVLEAQPELAYAGLVCTKVGQAVVTELKEGRKLKEEKEEAKESPAVTRSRARKKQKRI